jgi:hypothetical protein
VAEIIKTPGEVDEISDVFAYEGNFNNGLFLKIMHIVEERLEKSEPGIRIKKRIFNILVEALQNIIHCFEELKYETAHRLVSISLLKDKLGYTISVCNQVPNDRVVFLKLLLDKINSLNHGQLINLYRERLVASGTNGKAGLGLLDIKRRAGSNIGYRFKFINNKYSIFDLIVRVIA